MSVIVRLSYSREDMGGALALGEGLLGLRAELMNGDRKRGRGSGLIVAGHTVGDQEGWGTSCSGHPVISLG